jgi:cell division GTPase FtsZ
LSGNVIVVGCGGGGCNAVFHLNKISDIPTVTINTGMHENVTIQMANKSVQGCMGDRDLGWALATDYKDEISKSMEGYRYVIAVASLGGGTGSGTVPVISQCVREAGARLISVISVPMPFETDKRARAMSQIKDVTVGSDRTILFDIGRAYSMGGMPLLMNQMVFATNELMCETILRISRMLSGPFFSLLSQDVYTVAYAISNTPIRSVVSAMGACFFDTDPASGKIIVDIDSKLSVQNGSQIAEAICDRTGIMPEITSSKDGENVGTMLFIPISSRSLLS